MFVYVFFLNVQVLHCAAEASISCSHRFFENEDVGKVRPPFVLSPLLFRALMLGLAERNAKWLCSSAARIPSISTIIC